MNKKIKNVLLKKNKTKIVSLTAYSKSIGKILDKYVDIVLVGDSMANVLYGHKNTHKISLENIIQHAQSVKMGIKKSLLVVDMPKGTYDSSKKALKNAKLIIKKTKCDAVKLENNGNNSKIIKSLTKNKIPVMGHIGYTPQFNKFKIAGKTKIESLRLLKDAKLIEEAGAFSIILECVTASAAKLVTKKIKIPTIGIGSSSNCDGQILVTDDMLGISGFYPKFVKKYINLERIIEKAIKKYTREIKEEKFPKLTNFLNGRKNRKKS
jgi:3-methyl-2-oxobutanoate hydroxymethyltransferase